MYHLFYIVGLCFEKDVKKARKEKEKALEHRKNFQRIIAFRIHNKIWFVQGHIPNSHTYQYLAEILAP